MAILILAMFIASIGLNMNSTAVIIGAMLISPLMGVIMAIGYGIVHMIRLMCVSHFLKLLFQVGFCILTSTIYFLYITQFLRLLQSYWHVQNLRYGTF